LLCSAAALDDIVLDPRIGRLVADAQALVPYIGAHQTLGAA
jgi:hypothetical protein